MDLAAWAKKLVTFFKNPSQNGTNPEEMALFLLQQAYNQGYSDGHRDGNAHGYKDPSRR